MANSSVTDTVNLISRPGTVPGITQSRHFCARVRGVEGIAPVFRIGPRERWQTPRLVERHRAVWTADVHSDQWFRFDNITVDEERDQWVAWNETPFLDDTIFVANVPSFTCGRYEQLMQGWIESPFSRPTDSAITGYKVGEYSATEGPNEKLLPAMDCLALQVGTGPRRVALISGIHTDEIGHWIFEGAVRAIFGQDQLGTLLREKFTFLVYPNVNAQGLYGGYSRCVPDANLDANRVWASESIPNKMTSIYKPVWTQDAAPGVSAVFDFHSSPGTDPTPYPGRDVWERRDIVTETARQPFMDALSFYGDYHVGNSNFTANNSTNAFWRSVSSPKLVLTIEYTHSAEHFIDDWRAYGFDVMSALLDIADAHLPA